MGGNPLTLEGNMVKVGDAAQDFTVLAPDLSPVKLSDYAGKVRIISVVPSIDTPVCDTQTRQFNKEASGLPGVEILTVSCDLPFALGRFAGLPVLTRYMYVPITGIWILVINMVLSSRNFVC